jgi:hypothetical protein
MLNRDRNRLSEENLAAENLTYDLAEGHHITLKGSMNVIELPEGYEGLLLSLLQNPSDEAAMAQMQLDTNAQ